MPERDSKQQAAPRRLAVPLLLVAFPAILFYTILLRNVLDIPILDDYDALLDFVNHLIPLNGALAKASYFLAAQHNEYKLYFVNGMAWLQVALLGHIDFRILSAIGDGFVLLLAILLWKMFLPHHKDLAARLTLFIPVSWLLFQLQYFETLNWSMAALQNIPILVFSFAAIYFLIRGTRATFFGAVIFFILAVAASGNGFLLIPVGLLILVVNRRYLRFAAWLVVSGGCIAVYAYHYNVLSSQTGSHRSVFSAFHPLAPAYVLAFIGSAASFPFKTGSLILGAMICIFFCYLAWRGYIRRNPLVSCCILFLLLTAVGVAGIRSDFGLSQALNSRYTIYSALLLIFAWFAIVEAFLQDKHAPFLSNNAFLGAVAIAVLFSLTMDGLGSMQIAGRHRKLIEAMAAYEHRSSQESAVGPAPVLPGSNAMVTSLKFNGRIRPILAESIRLGIYRPPPL
jgi:hypothetical protein